VAPPHRPSQHLLLLHLHPLSHSLTHLLLPLPSLHLLPLLLTLQLLPPVLKSQAAGLLLGLWMPPPEVLTAQAAAGWMLSWLWWQVHRLLQVQAQEVWSSWLAVRGV
jgi:hypothetical protein